MFLERGKTNAASRHIMDSLLRVRPPEKPQRIFGLHLKSTYVICYSLPLQSSCSNAVTGDAVRKHGMDQIASEMWKS